jgi:molybdate transport system substrate-binding protein
MSKMKRSITAIVGVLLALMTATGCRKAQHPVLTVSIAASLQQAMVDVEAAYMREHGAVEFRNNFGASGALAREIEQGAPVDLFISAGAKPMDQIDGEGLLLAHSRTNLLRNSLVMIVPRDSKMQNLSQLTEPGVRLVALGDPASVPAGQYGRQSLESLHLFDKLQPKLVLGKDVRQVLTYIETGDADAGFVYATDAVLSNKVRVAAVVPEGLHDPIVYPAAAVKGCHDEAAARAFGAFLQSAAAKAIFVRYGFTMASS